MRNLRYLQDAPFLKELVKQQLKKHIIIFYWLHKNKKTSQATPNKKYSLY